MQKDSEKALEPLLRGIKTRRAMKCQHKFRGGGVLRILRTHILIYFCINCLLTEYVCFWCVLGAYLVYCESHYHAISAILNFGRVRLGAPFGQFINLFFCKWMVIQYTFGTLICIHLSSYYECYKQKNT